MQSKDRRSRLTVRLKPEDHLALKRMTVELNTSMTALIDLLISKSVPRKYYGDVYNQNEESDNLSGQEKAQITFIEPGE